MYRHTRTDRQTQGQRQRDKHREREREEHENLLRQTVVITAQYEKQFFILGKLLGDFS